MFAIAEDVRIAAPPCVIKEIVDSFADVAWHEAGLTTKVIKNKIYVQPFAREGWVQFLEETPRNPLGALPIHDIPDGSFLTDPSDMLSTRQWNDDGGINALGTPLGSPDSSSLNCLAKASSIAIYSLLCRRLQKPASLGRP